MNPFATPDDRYAEAVQRWATTMATAALQVLQDAGIDDGPVLEAIGAYVSKAKFERPPPDLTPAPVPEPPKWKLPELPKL